MTFRSKLNAVYFWSVFNIVTFLITIENGNNCSFINLLADPPGVALEKTVDNEIIESRQLMQNFQKFFSAVI